MMVAPATVVVATEAASGYGGGRLGFALASSADGDAVEGGTDPSSHGPGVLGSIWRTACVCGVKPPQRLRAGRTETAKVVLCGM